ncbi:hypothetical protein CALVIDRAFT_569691 [Calocera viscosa TUFC12733]|uniref:Uncharacterized protein n=1 Tax=Calocera viscosa (strain TUFC12733) TaxID=1330018 RepID=A0A167FPU3_CALVF|nr:hypothetical protein CALVIDRAFT_569691 [Calocera viscosa TUFC12733]
MPKVTYCIHALFHLLARRDIAQNIGSLLATLEISEDQLAATKKGLNGVAMPNFGDVGVRVVERDEGGSCGSEGRKWIERELLEPEDRIIIF